MARLLSEETTDLSGGMNDDLAATAYPANAVSLLLNARLEPDGTARRRDGSRRKHVSQIASGVGYGGTGFQTAEGVRQVLAFIGDEAWMSDDPNNSDWVLVGESLHEDFWSFATMRVGAEIWLICANGGDDLWRWDGVTLTPLSGAPEKVKFIAVFNGRLYAAGHQGVIVQASRVANPNQWDRPFGITVQTMTHDGSEPTGLYQVGAQLLVFNRESTSYIDGYGESTLVVATDATGFSRSVGCIAHRTIQGVGENAACWLSKRGIEYYTPGSGIRLLSRPIQRFMQNMNRDQIDQNPGQPTSCFDPETQTYHVAIPTRAAAGTRNDRTVVANLLLTRRNQPGALSVDRPLAEGAGILFGSGDFGYLVEQDGGWGALADNDGLWELLTSGESGDSITEDDDGYLAIAIDDTLPATLFYAPSNEQRNAAVHSLGWDGYVREHDLGDADDAGPDGEGGVPVSMVVVSRPFLYGSPRTRKRARAVHLATINSEQATLEVAVRSGGSAAPYRSVDIPPTSFNQPRRRRVMVSNRGDAPQVEVVTSDRVRIATIGLSSEVLREPV